MVLRPMTSPHVMVRYIHHFSVNLGRATVPTNQTGGYLGMISISNYWLTLSFDCFKGTAGLVITLKTLISNISYSEKN